MFFVGREVVVGGAESSCQQSGLGGGGGGGAALHARSRAPPLFLTSAQAELKRKIGLLKEARSTLRKRESSKTVRLCNSYNTRNYS